MSAELARWAWRSVGHWIAAHRPWERAPTPADAHRLAQAYLAGAGETLPTANAAQTLALPDDAHIQALRAETASYALTEEAFRTYALLTRLACDRALFLVVQRFAAWNRQQSIPVRLAVRIANPFTPAAATLSLLPEALVARERTAGADYWWLAREPVVPIAGSGTDNTHAATATSNSEMTLPTGVLARVRARGDDEVPLVLSELAQEGLAHVRARVRHAAAVHGQTQGLFVLFAGPRGHGRRSAIRMLAGELGLELWAVRSGALTSPWIGETEKRVSALFDRMARSGGALLVEDAADLFAPRTEVSRASDRYANQATNHLLQAVDSFQGICFLSGEGTAGFDPAMRRRIAVTVTFTEVPPARVLATAADWLYERTGLAPPTTPDWQRLGKVAQGFEPAGIVRVLLSAAFGASVAESPLDASRIESALQQEARRRGNLVATVGPLEGRRTPP